MADDSLRLKLREYLTREVLRDPAYPLGDGDPLISSGLVDSFSLVDVALWVEDNLGVRIDNSELNADHFDTLAELADLIAQRQNS
jgi:acyl carrier protein